MNEATQLERPGLVPALIGTGLALGATALVGLTMVWVGAFPWAVVEVWGGLWVAFGAAAGLVLVCAHQWWHWRVTPDAAREPLSWWLHVASYVLVLTLVLAATATMTWIDPIMVGFWLLVGALVLGLLAQTIGAVQFVRPDGPPGSLGAHVRAWLGRAQSSIEAANAREDARVDAE